MDRVPLPIIRYQPAAQPHKPEALGALPAVEPAQAPERASGPCAAPPEVFSRVVPQHAESLVLHLAESLSDFAQTEFADEPSTPGCAQARAQAIKVAQGAFIGAAGTGPVFGIAFALMSAARFKWKANPPMGILAGGLAMGAGAASAYSEQWWRDRTGIQATAPARPSLGVDCAASIALLAVNRVFIRASGIPKFVPNTPQAAAMTLFISCLSTFAAGGAGEAAAQHSRHRALATGAPLHPPRCPTTRQRATSRGLSQVPTVLANQLAFMFMLNPARAPRWKDMVIISSAAGGWIARNQFIPDEPQEPPKDASTRPAAPTPPPAVASPFAMLELGRSEKPVFPRMHDFIPI